MAEVTVSQLAETVGAPVDRLLKQMKEAGLSHSAAEQPVSDDDKQALLAFLKNSHGDSASAPKKITLKRKTLSTLKTGSGPGKKTVNVEVRKKRTYVKKPLEELAAAPVDEPELVLEVPEVADAPEAIVAEAPPPVPEVIEQAPEVVPEPEPEPVVAAPEVEKPSLEGDSLAGLDPEVLRQRAQRRRQEAEEVERERRARALATKKADEEVAAAEKARLAAIAAAPAPDAEKPGVKRKGRVSAEPARDDNDSRRKRGDKGRHRNEKREKGNNGLHLGPRRKRKSTLKLPDDMQRHEFQTPTEKIVREIELPELISVGDLAQKMMVKAGEVIKELMKLGVMATINQPLDQETAQLVVEEMGHVAITVSDAAIEEALEVQISQREGTLEARPPVVTVMGHVDHGKTSLLDYIRSSRVASGEAGGITQHIGAYQVDTAHGRITFLDTPGHAAFTAMRARGAKSTDIVILVVAADDGVMPQTVEAVTHAKAAGVPLIVAVNKMDKEGADPDRVRNELAAKDVIPEDWGGDTQFVHVSAQTGDGIEALLEAVNLQAELLELQAAYDVPAQGVVIESSLDKGRGSVATILIQSGTLKQGQIVLAGQCVGRVRAMLDENGAPIDSAGPSVPVEILGLDGTPNAGDGFVVVESEKQAREVAEFRFGRDRDQKLQRQQASKLDRMFESMGVGDKQVLNIVLKADVRGSLEAIQSALPDLGNEEVSVNIVSGGVGGITETEVNLAITAGAVLFGFNVRADNSARKLAENESVDLRYYSVIYDLMDDVKAALTGMLSPEMREEIVGIAEVRDVFTSPKFGLIAGCMVVEGNLLRSNPIRVLRDNVVIYEGELESLRRFKDDVNEVRNGFECGIGVKNYNDVKAGDKIEVFQVKEFARTL